MDISLTFTDFQHALEEFRQQTGADHSIYGCETYLELPHCLGEGHIRSIQVREGIDLFLQNYWLQEDLNIKYLNTELLNSRIALKFCLSGSISGSILGGSSNLVASSNQYGLVYSPENVGETRFSASQPILTVELAIDPNTFVSVIGSDFYSLKFEPILVGNLSVPFWDVGTISTTLKIALYQILNCPYQGATRRLYLESKSLEIIAIYLDQFKPAQVNLQQKSPLKPEDVKRLYQARDILIDRMDNPPTLHSLARQVGINDCKLKQEFRQVFGTTVFGYLHNYRMERAAQLLIENNQTVAGVAYTVGYAHRGAFAAAFKRKFGVNPSDYLGAHQRQHWTFDQKSPASDRRNSG